MSLIIAARFDTFEHARSGADVLLRNGVSPDDMHTFFVNPAGAHSRLPIGGDRMADPDSKGAPFGAVGGAAIFAVVGAVIGALIGFNLNNALLPVIGGAGVGAYVGSLIGGVSRLGRGRDATTSATTSSPTEETPAARPSGVLLAVRVDASRQQEIAGLLRETGGVEIERAQGRWEDGQWRDFDPLETPAVQPDPMTGATERGSSDKDTR